VIISQLHPIPSSSSSSPAAAPAHHSAAGAAHAAPTGAAQGHSRPCWVAKRQAGQLALDGGCALGQSGPAVAVTNLPRQADGRAAQDSIQRCSCCLWLRIASQFLWGGRVGAPESHSPRPHTPVDHPLPL
jgi:hypothetical protein